MTAPVKIVSEKSISTIAEEIRLEHVACEQAATSAVGHAIKAGELLIEAKTQVPHGEWLPWITKNIPFTQQTANTYMRIFENYGRSRDLPNSVNAALKQIAAKTYVCPECRKDRSPSRFRPGADHCNVCIKEAQDRAEANHDPDGDRDLHVEEVAEDTESEWYQARIRKAGERFAGLMGTVGGLVMGLPQFREQRYFRAALWKADADELRDFRREINQARRELLELRGDLDRALDRRDSAGDES